MKILFIGGTGIISSACSELCLEKGFDLYLLNRGQSFRKVPSGAKWISGDYRDSAQIKSILQNENFDVVVDWISFLAEHVQNAFELFRDKTQQYVFISSASAYQKPLQKLPVTEATPLSNPYWQYARNKIACENFLLQVHTQADFPVTIVRPSHTYDRTTIPLKGGYIIFDRMQKKKPIIIHGDGTSLWVLTHHKDFARGFTGLLGNSHAVGEAYHITSDELLTWNRILEIMAEAAGLKAQVIHIPSEVIARYDAEWGASLLGDKAHSMIFDNSKIKKAVPGFSADIPFSDGAKEIVAWYFSDKSHQLVNTELDALMDRMIMNFK